MGSSNSQPYKQNYIQNTDNSRELDPAVKQFLYNLNMFTKTVCQQPLPNSASGPNNNILVFVQLDQQTHQTFSGPEESPYSRTSGSPYGQNPYDQNPYAESPYANLSNSDSVIIIERENYENSHDALNYGTIKDTWKRQAKYSL